MATVVVLTYSADPSTLAGCLRAAATAHDTDELVLVDNGGRWTPEGARQLIADSGADLPLTVLRCFRNLGFGGGINAGLSVALDRGASEVAILNDDARPAPDWITKLRRHVGGHIGAAQPKLLLPDGRVQSVGVDWRRDGAGRDTGYGAPDDGRHDGVTTIRCFTGGAVLFSRQFLLDVGGFDARFHLYYEDVDLALRGAAAGYRFVVDTAAVVVHAMSHSTSAEPARRRYYQERNRLWCLARHGTIGGLGLGLVTSVARGVRHPTGAQWTAIRDGCAGIVSRRRERRAGLVRTTTLPMPTNDHTWEVL